VIQYNLLELRVIIEEAEITSHPFAWSPPFEANFALGRMLLEPDKGDVVFSANDSHGNVKKLYVWKSILSKKGHYFTGSTFSLDEANSETTLSKPKSVPQEGGTTFLGCI
jgi:hypothetical protein